MTELGIVTDVRLVQNKKEAKPIVVTEFGIVTEVKPVHDSKAKLPMLVLV